MAKTDQANNVAPILHIGPDNYTATVTGGAAGIGFVPNLQGYEGCTFIIQTGEIADGTWTVTFQESVTSNFAVPIPITNGDETKLIGDIPGPFDEVMDAWDNKIYKVGYIGNLQYVRCVITLSGGSGDADLAVSVILGDPHSAPVSVGFA